MPLSFRELSLDEPTNLRVCTVCCEPDYWCDCDDVAQDYLDFERDQEVIDSIR